MKKWKFLLILLTLLAGAAVRIVVFLQNRSLFLDEANLARNIAEREGWAFFRPLDYEQFAPPVFAWLVKCSTQVFGNTEWALRLVPLLAGLVSLYLFYRLAEALIPVFPIRWLAIWVFAFHTQLLRYATECKQYGTDVFAALLVLWLAHWQSSRPFTSRHAVAWGLFGTVMVWFSMPVVFMLTGVGIYLGVLFWVKKDKNALLRLGLSIVAWLLSFGVFFFMLLKRDAEGDYLQQFHGPYFLPLLPHTSAQWAQWGRLTLSLVKSLSGPTVVAEIVGVAGLLSAWIFWARKRNPEGLLYTLPLIACLLASGLHYYSLIGRLVLFLIPILILSHGYGWSVLWEKARPWLRPVIFLGLLFLAGNHKSFNYFQQPYQVAEIRPALQFVASNMQPEDGLYLGKWAVPAFDFYTRRHTQPLHFSSEKIFPSTHSFSDDFEKITREAGNDRVWLVYTHLLSNSAWEDMESELVHFRERGSIEGGFHSKGTEVWLWKPQNKASSESANTSTEGG